MNKALVVILLSVTLDAVGIGLIMPILPTLLRDLTGIVEIAFLYGAILAAYGAMAFLFAPILGMLSDRYGRRPILMLAMGGAALDYLVMAFAPNIEIFVLGRLVAGITAASMAVSMAYIADISVHSQRTKRFGLLYACFGVGFIIGPVIGGLLGELWIKAPFLLAAALNAINLLLAIFLLPESRQGTEQQFNWKEMNPFKPLMWAFHFQAIRPLLSVMAIMGFIGAVYVSVWVLFLEDKFGWSMAMIGLSLAAYGVFQALAQAFLAGTVASRFGEKNTILLGVYIELLALCLIAFAGYGWMVFALLPLFAMGGIGEPALQSLLSIRVGEDNQGKLQGVLTSLVTLASVLGLLIFPALYGLLKPIWPGGIWMIALLLYAAVIPVIIFGERSKNKPS